MRRSLVLIPASLGLVASGLFAAPAHAVSWACDVKVTKLTHGVRAWSPYPTPDPCHLVQAKYEYYANGSVHVVLGSQSQYLNAASDAEDPDRDVRGTLRPGDGSGGRQLGALEVRVLGGLTQDRTRVR